MKKTFFTKSQAENVDSQKTEENRRAMKLFLDGKIKDNKIVLKDAMNRNIIFVGKTRSGKSTALETLKNPFHFVQQSSIFSETIDAYISHFTVEVGDVDDKYNFNISIIDTPGLFEVSDKGTARDNEILEDIVLKCMNSEITKIHAIYFVFSYTGAINPQDIEALGRFIKLFDGAQQFVNILITKCENLDENAKSKVKEELLKYPDMSQLLGNTSKNIFFAGAVENMTYDKGFIDAFKSHMDNVIMMREDIFDNVFQNESSFSLNTLTIVDKVKKRAEELYKLTKQQYNNRTSEVGIPNVGMFKASCKKLASWLPLLNQNDYDDANKLLCECEKYIKDLEIEKPTETPTSTPTKNDRKNKSKK